uniref:Uncharacterized protein n=1 Tax=Acrobeloides nanus TaxID=290746 RepID=A0A914CK80_9BILA
MKSSKSPEVFDYNKVSQSLALREAIRKLSLNSEETVKFLNGQESIWSKTTDPAIHCALETLRKCYHDIKTEIFRANDTPPNKEGFMRFLANNASESSTEIVDRYIKECIDFETKPQQELREWRQLEVSPISHEKEKVPKNVPPLDPEQVKECSIWSGESSSSDQVEVFREHPQIPLKVISDRVIPSSESSSRSTSTSSSSRMSLTNHPQQEKILKSASDHAIQVQNQNSRKSIQGSPSLLQKPTISHRSTMSDEKVTSRFLPREELQKSSRAVQTEPEIIKIDVATGTDSFDAISNSNRSGSINFPPHNNSSNSSSYFSSSNSTGQIPTQKAAVLSNRPGYKVLSFQPDGSLHARTSVATASDFIFNTPETLKTTQPFRLSSTPQRKVQVHEIFEEKIEKSSKCQPPSRPHVGSSNSSKEWMDSSVTNLSAIFASEFSIHTSFELEGKDGRKSENIFDENDIIG